uniref:Glycosyltransferase RgtA/B/C/D-like domain-containing protein n=1 Tax=Anopheles coluzzii TaxID=1518534 RepID=A0A8W7Q295_ANOCL
MFPDTIAIIIFTVVAVQRVAEKCVFEEQSHKSYRPLCVLTFRWNYLLHGLEPAGYHLVNVLLHTIVSLMYFRMCAMLLSETASFAAALLFAVHPIHTEAVTGVVGRAETLSSVFFLAAFIFYTKATRRKKSTGWRFLCLSMLFVATAMLCKEQGITITGVCAIYEIFVAQKYCSTVLPRQKVTFANSHAHAAARYEFYVSYVMEYAPNVAE